ncbi:ATP-grasp domain-containing protein [Niveibacterium terrae]|uniref:ATP-grasp domain-containing protein n=1 Tax=Niveibacterium terrae TaxID=3373598 RepID=UPI003A93A047
MTLTATGDSVQADTPFMGLAPFLRMNISGDDLSGVAQALMAQAQESPGDANLWMNLATAMLCLGHRDIGLAMQAQALDVCRIYDLPALEQPAKFRLLMLMAPGDLAANTPLDCLLEVSDIDLIYYFVSSGDPLALPVPEHDAVIVAMSEADENRAALAALETALANWPKPVINRPQSIPNIGREKASELLRDAPGVMIPATLHASRALLEAVAAGATRLSELFADCDFPVILRPVGSHAGRDLARIASPEEVAVYLARVDEAEFFLSRFIDYRSPDGMFRKYRVALIAGEAFACHMGISSHWMIHYVNAGMYEDAGKRAEEARFMEGFAAFKARHREALAAIHARSGLDYVCVDCAETADGKLFVFELDHAMVVHAMDPEAMFPYKQLHMARVREAFRAYLIRLGSGRPERGER